MCKRSLEEALLSERIGNICLFTHSKPSDLGNDWYVLNGIVRKTRNNKIIPNEFIIITGNNCYEMIIKDDYSLKFNQLSWITDNPKLENCLYHKFKRFKDYRPGCLITYNDFILCFGGSAENILKQENDHFKWIFIYDMIDNKWYRADIEWYLLPKQDWAYTAFILKEDNDSMICHIIGSTGLIAERPGSRRSYLDTDKAHWKLYRPQ